MTDTAPPAPPAPDAPVEPASVDPTSSPEAPASETSAPDPEGESETPAEEQTEPATDTEPPLSNDQLAETPSPEPEPDPADAAEATETETPEPGAPVAAEPPVTQLIPTTTFHDTREVAAAEQAGVPSPTGHPLSASAHLALVAVEEGLSNVEGWVAEVRKRLARARSIGTGV